MGPCECQQLSKCLMRHLNTFITTFVFYSHFCLRLNTSLFNQIHKDSCTKTVQQAKLHSGNKQIDR